LHSEAIHLYGSIKAIPDSIHRWMVEVYLRQGWKLDPSQPSRLQ